MNLKPCTLMKCKTSSLRCYANAPPAFLFLFLRNMLFFKEKRKEKKFEVHSVFRMLEPATKEVGK